jgi:hypothetical protein
LPRTLGVDTGRDRAEVVKRALDLVAELRDEAALVRVLELVACHAEVDAQRDETLLGAVVQVALDAPPLGVAGGDDARPRVAQLALEVAVLDREDRRRRRRPHELGVLGEGRRR